MSFFINDAYAQDAPAQAGTLELILPLLLMFAIFYFLLIRPQKKQMKEQLYEHIEERLGLFHDKLNGFTKKLDEKAAFFEKKVNDIEKDTVWKISD